MTAPEPSMNEVERLVEEIGRNVKTEYQKLFVRQQSVGGWELCRSSDGPVVNPTVVFAGSESECRARFYTEIGRAALTAAAKELDTTPEGLVNLAKDGPGTPSARLNYILPALEDIVFSEEEKQHWRLSSRSSEQAIIERLASLSRRCGELEEALRACIVQLEDEEERRLEGYEPMSEYVRAIVDPLERARAALAQAEKG